MKTILLATDFSIAALNAANYATDMALTINATIMLLHVCSLPVSYGEIPSELNTDDLLRDTEKNIYNLKTELTRRSAGKLSIETEVRTGVFFNELTVVCEQIKPYAVVMGSQGTTAAERMLFGAHSTYAMKNLNWPLITVPIDAKFSTIKKIGLACDFDHVTDTIPVDEIKMLINDTHAKLHVLNTGKQNAFSPELIFQSGLLQEMLIDLTPDYHFISSENVEEGIISFAEKNQIDLLIVIPKQHRMFYQITHKSHTKQLVLHSHIPVMALHSSHH